MAEKKLRVVYLGNFIPEWSTENDVRKAFEQLGHEVVQMQEDKVTVEQIKNEALNSDLFLITSTWDDALPLSEMLDFYKQCADKDIPTATLHLDTFWSVSRGGRKWWLNPMFHTAYIMTADGDYQDKWELLGKNHLWLKPALRHDAAKFGTERPEFECDVALVGSNGKGYHEDVWTYRTELAEQLRAMCERNGWKWRNPGGDEPKIDRGHDMNDFYASAKITVGDSLCLNREESKYWSDRVPEATGRGGFLIMPHIKAMKYDWPKLPTYNWGDWKQLESMIKYYLEHEDERHAIQLENQRITMLEHTYVNRAKTIIKLLDLDK